MRDQKCKQDGLKEQKSVQRLTLSTEMAQHFGEVPEGECFCCQAQLKAFRSRSAITSLKDT
jgi:hypothetical protein